MCDVICVTCDYYDIQPAYTQQEHYNVQYYNIIIITPQLHKSDSYRALIRGCKLLLPSRSEEMVFRIIEIKNILRGICKRFV